MPTDLHQKPNGTPDMWRSRREAGEPGKHSITHYCPLLHWFRNGAPWREKHLLFELSLSSISTLMPDTWKALVAPKKGAVRAVSTFFDWTPDQESSRLVGMPSRRIQPAASQLQQRGWGVCPWLVRICQVGSSRSLPRLEVLKPVLGLRLVSASANFSGSRRYVPSALFSNHAMPPVSNVWLP